MFKFINKNLINETERLRKENHQLNLKIEKLRKLSDEGEIFLQKRNDRGQFMKKENPFCSE